MDPDEEIPRTEWWIDRATEDLLREYPDIFDLLDDPDLQGQIASKILASPHCERLLHTGELTTRDKLELVHEYWAPLIWGEKRGEVEPPEPAPVQGELRVQRDALAAALSFLKRSRTTTRVVTLSSDGTSLLLECGAWKAGVPGVGDWTVHVTLDRDRFLELRRLLKLLPETVVLAAAEPYLRVDAWSLEAETVPPSDAAA